MQHQRQSQGRGNNSGRDDDVQVTPTESRQGPRGVRMWYVLAISLLLSALAGAILMGWISV
ncbi:MAG: hypothetical protein NW215_02885 [Hyphomicrobiales bacterium]|nr:hypothetical protein [Hyphomicrobiales bacterium]